MPSQFISKTGRAQSFTRALDLPFHGFLTRVTIVWIPGCGVVFKSIRKQWVTHCSSAAGLHVGTFSPVCWSHCPQSSQPLRQLMPFLHRKKLGPWNQHRGSFQLSYNLKKRHFLYGVFCFFKEKVSIVLAVLEFTIQARLDSKLVELCLGLKT